MKTAFVQVDGASKGNPGPSGIGIVVLDCDGNVLREISENIGVATNNFAEYSALIRALEEVKSMGFSRVYVQTDSELMARQINGVYRVKNDSIIPLFTEVSRLKSGFEHVEVVHVLREMNKAADKLASKAASGSREPVQQPLLVEEELFSPVIEESPVQQGQSESGVQRIPVRTARRSQFVDITDEVQKAIESSGVSDGVCTVFVPHTTAGITINENADPDVVTDILDTLNRLVPQSNAYRHREGNADSHVKASMMGFSVSIFVENGRLVMGTWQGIYFCEFDGPRNREVYVKVY